MLEKRKQPSPGTKVTLLLVGVFLILSSLVLTQLPKSKTASSAAVVENTAPASTPKEETPASTPKEEPTKTETPSTTVEGPAKVDTSVNTEQPASTEKPVETEKPAVQTTEPNKEEKPSSNETKPSSSEEKPSSNGDKPASSETKPSSGNAVKEETKPEPNSATKETQIKVVETVPSLSLASHKNTPVANYDSTQSLPMLFPLYTDKFRIQVKEFVRGSQPYAIFEIGNTSNEIITITDENLQFVLVSDSGEDIAKSKVVNGPISIKPNTVVPVKVTAQNSKAVILRFQYGDLNKLYVFGNGKAMNDTTPLNTGNGERAVTLSSYSPAGTGKFKFQAQKVVVTDNTNFGNFTNAKGTLVLVKVTVVNTSKETLKIQSITDVLYNGATDSVERLDISASDVKSIGSNALPLEIKPNTIVEGYLPAVVDPSHVSSLVIKTNLGEMDFSQIGGYSKW